ncbi:AMP-dependent synthetase/ligase [Nocardia tengchongensis]
MASTFAAGSTTTCQAFQATVARNPHAVAVRAVGGGPALTFAQWDEQARVLAAGLAALGVRRGDRVALMMANRPEFYPIDVAVQHLGATPFSIYNTAAPDQINYVLTDSAARIVVCERQFLNNIVKARAGTAVEYVICLDDEADADLTVAELGAAGLPDFDFETAWRAVESDDVLTLIYTSGTTGAPKGVQITHANMLAVLDGSEQLWNSSPDSRLLSFLPSAHIADRWSALYHLMVVGNQVTTVADRHQLMQALTETRPTVFGAVPQVWQKLSAGIDAELAKATGVKAALAGWAVGIGRRVSDARLDGKGVSPILLAQHLLADRLVLSALRAAVGLDATELALSGAAPVAAETLRYFNALGIPVSDAWGMSETSAMITMSPRGKVRPGTVGAPLPGVRLRIADDGEVLVHGPSVMKGYLNRPEQTSEAIDPEGWLHTGDIGEIDDEGYLTIVDRKKELIINAGGKNMSPSNIENWIKAFSPLIGQAVAIGDNRNYNVALIVLDPDAVAPFAARIGLPCDAAILAESEALRAEIDRAVREANTKLARVEQIKKYAIVPDFWEPGTDVLTPTLKLRRRPINERYAALIEDLYA